MLFRSQNRGLDGRPDLGESWAQGGLREGSFSRKRTDKLSGGDTSKLAHGRARRPSAEGLTESPAAIRANAMSQIMGAIGVEGERDVSLPPVNAVGRRSSSGRRHSFS